MLSAITTGAGGDAYGRDGLNYYTIHELLAPLHQVARFCGMRWVPPFVVHDTMQQDDDYLHDTALAYRAALEGLSDGSLDVDGLPPDSLLNDAVTSTEAKPDAG